MGKSTFSRKVVPISPSASCSCRRAWLAVGWMGGSQGGFRQVNETVLTGSLGDARKVSTALSDGDSGVR